jgi:serine/threonine protein kinase
MATTNNNGYILQISDTAHAQWKHQYGTPRITLKRDDQNPFKLVRPLGRGGFGDVHETDLNGVVVALKRVYFRNTPRERPLYENELHIMEKLSGKRHRHIVELIGCYEHLSRGVCELGLLIWPVAQCDLARYLGYVDILRSCIARNKTHDQQDTSVCELQADEEETLEEVAKLVRLPWEASLALQQSALYDISRIYQASLEYLRTIFGCLAQAIAHLHNDQMIRHKDLKPFQVLLAPDGLWLTDFGWSLDISDLSNSATNNGANISAKYHAPERASRGQQYCGRPEDIFALGCTYLEMMYRLCEQCFDSNVNEKRGKGWSYQAHLDQVDEWLHPLLTCEHSDASMRHLGQLIKKMMARNAVSRPLISDVVSRLAIRFPNDRFFGKCCSTGM